jgi:YHYH protein
MLKITIILFTIFGVIACKKTEETSPSTTTTTTTSSGVDISVLKDKFYSTSAFSSTATAKVEGDFLVITTNGIPDHKSPYFGSTDTRYELYNGTNTKFKINPNAIVAQSLVFKIPLKPTEAKSKTASGLGAIGVSVNGVPFYNQYAGPNQPLSNEIDSFDQYAGHPQQSGQYHYHIEPTYLTKTKGSDAFLGLLLDGFPVYGPLENGKTITNSDLDAYHGHTSKTADFPNGIYHYHITSTDPYINGSAYFGTAGTVSR